MLTDLHPRFTDDELAIFQRFATLEIDLPKRINGECCWACRECGYKTDNLADYKTHYMEVCNE